MQPIKVAVVGQAGVGKSCVVFRFVQDKFRKVYDPTLQDQYQKEIIVDGVQHRLSILDTAGQEEYESLRDEYFANSDCFILMYSVDSPESLEKIEQLAMHMKRVRNNSQLPIILVGNKCDLDDKAVTMQQAVEVAHQLQCEVYEASAKENINVKEVFQAVVRRALTSKKSSKIQVQALTQNAKKKKMCE